MEDDEKLIEAVRSFPCLWQTSSKSYKNMRVRENAWKEVAKQVSSKSSKINNIYSVHVYSRVYQLMSL